MTPEPSDAGTRITKQPVDTLGAPFAGPEKASNEERQSFGHYRIVP